MCGRVSVTTKTSNIAEFFLALQFADHQPRYNITPAQYLPAVRIDPQMARRTLSDFYWGLIPPWAKDPKISSRLTNARGETLREKPSFRGAFKYRRCLIPVNGFYEWKREGKRKQPYYFKMIGDVLIAFAGLWEYWCGPAGEELLTCTIITTEANPLMAPIHHRMPVILQPGDFDQWLDPDLRDGRRVQHLIKPYEGDQLTCYPVTSYVNTSVNEGPRCIEPQQEQQPEKNEDSRQMNLFD